MSRLSHRLRLILVLCAALFALSVASASAKAPVALEKTGTLALSSEIVELLPGGDTMVATNDTGIRFIDASNPDALVPEPYFVPMNGETTSVTPTPDGKYALAGVRRPEKYAFDWVVVVSVAERSVVRRINVPKGPDAVAVSPDGKYAAVAIEADESSNDGSIVTLDIGDPDVAAWEAHNLTIARDHPGLGPGPEPEGEELPKPQPEFVDINGANEAAVSLQENNAMAIVDLETATITRIFNLGKRTITAEEIEAGALGVDKDDDDGMSFSDPFDAERWPDAVKWTADGKSLIVADEGENLGSEHDFGARTFSIWHPDGEFVNTVGDFEYQHALRGLYHDDRADNNGVTVEGVEVATMGGREIAFLATERAWTVAAYDITNLGQPKLIDIVETGIEPEGIIADPVDNVVYTADEETETISTIRVRWNLDDLAPNRAYLVSQDTSWANAAGLGTDFGGDLLFSGRYGPASVQQITALKGPRLPMHEVAAVDQGFGFRDIARDRFRGWVWTTNAGAALRAFAKDGTLKEEVPTVNSQSGAEGLEISTDGRFAYLSVGRLLIRYEIDTGTAKTLQVPSSHMPASNYQFSDLSWMPDGRLALLVSRFDRRQDARIEAIDAGLFETLADNANIPEPQFTLVKALPASESSSGRGPAALAIRANGDIWLANDADHGGNIDLRRFPKAAASTPAPVTPGSEVPSSTPSIDLRLSQGGQYNESTAALVGGKVLAFDGESEILPDHYGPLQVLDARTGEDRELSLPAFGIATGTVTIQRVISDGAGGAIVAGRFDTVGGVAHANIVRIKADGTVDPAFTLQADKAVRGLLLDGSTLYLGGEFRKLNRSGDPTTSVAGIARVDIATGAIDAAWLPKLVYTSTSGFVDRFAKDGTTLYVAGNTLKEIDAVATSRIGAVSTATGARIPFAATGFTGAVTDMVVYEGDLIVSGAQPGLVRRFEPDGSLYAPFEAGLCCGATSDLELLGGDLFLTANAFKGRTLEEGAPVEGSTERVVVKLDPDTGLFDSGWRDALLGDGSGSGSEGTLTQVGGRLVVVGDARNYSGTGSVGFVSLDPATGEAAFPREGLGVTTGRNVAQFGPDSVIMSSAPTGYSGRFRPPWFHMINPGSGDLDFGWRYGGTINDPRIFQGFSVFAADGDWVYVGNFSWNTELENGEVVEEFHRFDPATGEIDMDFQPFTDDQIMDIDFAGDRTYIVGEFGGVGGVARTRIAAIDRETGEVDKGFVAHANATAKRVENVEVGPEGNIWVAGENLTSINGVPVNGMAALDPVTGTVVDPGPVLVRQDGGPGTVDDLATHEESGRLAIYGEFAKVDGVAAKALAFLDPFSGLVTPIDAPLFYSSHNSLVSGPQGMLLYGFLQYQGQPATGISLFDPVTGKRNPDFQPAQRAIAWADFAGSAILAVGEQTPEDAGPLRFFRFDVTAPVNTTAPSIEGSAAEGETVTCNRGVWDGAPGTYGYEWLRDGSPIGAAVSPAYEVGSADVGHELRCRVTGTNSKGSAQATSAPITPVASALPLATVKPSLAGSGAEGTALTCQLGSWTNSPTSYARQWLRNGAEIAGQNGEQYTPVAADDGLQIACRVTATNGAGSRNAVSDSVKAVALPVNQALPALPATVTENVVAACDPGTWTGSPALSYAWLRDGSPTGVSTASYTPVAGDVGHQLSCRVTAVREGVATASATSAAKIVQPVASGSGTTGKVTLNQIPVNPLGELSVPIACTGPGKCAGEVVVLGKKDTLQEIAGAKFSFPAASGKVPMTLNALGVELMSGKEKFTVQIRVTIENGGGITQAKYVLKNVP